MWWFIFQNTPQNHLSLSWQAPSPVAAIFLKSSVFTLLNYLRKLLGKSDTSCHLFWLREMRKPTSRRLLFDRRELGESRLVLVLVWSWFKPICYSLSHTAMSLCHCICLYTSLAILTAMTTTIMAAHSTSIQVLTCPSICAGWWSC